MVLLCHPALVDHHLICQLRDHQLLQHLQSLRIALHLKRISHLNQARKVRRALAQCGAMSDRVLLGLISLTLRSGQLEMVLRNQEAKRVRDMGSLVFETPIQHDYEAGVEVRSLLSTEQLEEIDGRLAVTDVDPQYRTRYVRF